MIIKFKIFEGIRWWRDGKLGDEEEDNFQPDIQVGDSVKIINRKNAFYSIDSDTFINTNYDIGEKLIGSVKEIDVFDGYKCCLVGNGGNWYKMDCLEKN